MDNFKRSVKRVVIRLTILSLVVVGGAIAIAQAQKDREAAAQNTGELAQVGLPTFQEAGDSLRGLIDSNRGPNRASDNVAMREQSVDKAESAPREELIRDDNIRLVQATSGDLDSRFGAAGRAPASNSAAAATNRFADDRFGGDRFGEAPESDNSRYAADDDLDIPSPNSYPLIPDDEDAEIVGAPADRFGATSSPATSASNARLDEPPSMGGDSAYNAEPTLHGNTLRQGGTRPPIRQPAPVSQPPSGGPIEDEFGGNAPSVDPPTTSIGLPPADDRFGEDFSRQDPFPAQQEPVRPILARQQPSRVQESFASQEGLGRGFGGQPSANLPGANAPNANLSGVGPRSFAGQLGYEQLPQADAAEMSLSAGDEAGQGVPGPRELEGAQTPSVTIQKIAPVNVRVGQPATFQIKVRNAGQVTVDRILIRDEVPRGSEFIDATPQAQTSSDGAVTWQIGTLRPGEDATVAMQVRPFQEGTIGSVATVVIQGQASAKAEVTKPSLKIEHTGPRQVLAGEPVRFQIQLVNDGSGPADQVVIEEDVPEGLTHSKGPRLEYEVGTILPGATRRLELSLVADKPGMVENIVKARGAGGLVTEHSISLEVVAPSLQVKVTGPQRRYLEREATFALQVENSGSAPATNVELVAKMPQGLKFVSTNNSGRFDATTNSVRWSLANLPAHQYGEVKFSAVPTQVGDYNISAEASADRGLRDAQDHAMAVEGIAALLFTVTDVGDPIEVGGTITYEIRVKNQGTKTATNVQFVAQIPPGMQGVDADGPTNYRIEGDRVVFEPIMSLPAKGESTYRIRVDGVQAGDKRFRVQMMSDDNERPVVKEESTRVYSDQG